MKLKVIEGDGKRNIFEDLDALRIKDDDVVKRPKSGRKPRMPEIGSRWWAPVTVEQLKDRRFDIVYPARTRLYLFIVMRSRRGAKPFALSNAMAEELGIDKRQKLRILRELETHGLVVVDRTGKTTVQVTLVKSVTNFTHD